MHGAMPLTYVLNFMNSKKSNTEKAFSASPAPATNDKKYLRVIRFESLKKKFNTTKTQRKVFPVQFGEKIDIIKRYKTTRKCILTLSGRPILVKSLF